MNLVFGTSGQVATELRALAPVTVESLAIPEVMIIRPKKHGDARGFFSETFSFLIVK